MTFGGLVRLSSTDPKISRLKTISMEDMCRRHKSDDESAQCMRLYYKYYYYNRNVMTRVFQDITIMGGTTDGQTVTMVSVLFNLAI